MATWFNELPTERVQQILVHTLASQHDPLRRATFAVRQSFTLARVNRSLRELAINTPLLWTTIDLNCQKVAYPMVTIWMTYLALLLERSRQALLDIRLFWIDSEHVAPVFRRVSSLDPVSWPTASATEFGPLSAVLQESHRWRSLLVSATAMKTELQKVFLSVPLRQLEALAVCYDHSFEVTDGLLQNAPNLKELSVPALMFTRNGLTGQQLTQLSRLEIHSVFHGDGFEAFFQSLRLCGGTSNATAAPLKDLTLSAGSRSSLSHLPRGGELNFPHVERLFLNGHTIWAFASLAKMLLFPALRTVSIVNFETGQVPHHSFIQLCCGAVHSLNIQTSGPSIIPPTSAGLITDILSWCLELRELSISGYTLCIADVQALLASSVPLKTQTACRRPGDLLELISLPFGAFDKENRNAIVSQLLHFVELRSKASVVPAKLRRLDLPGHHDPDAQVLQITIRAMLE